ncbi:MAG: hypothetical protein KAG61_00170 [Bacteriovoracaceae bacterium]|nr:hypothetical protein [Bacteriovoracaceae bacterium]
MQNKQITILFNKTFTLESFEPTNIHYIHEYDFVSSLFSTLFVSDSSGDIVGGIAQNYSWNDNKLRVTLRENLKTSQGDLITSDDVVASIKRTLRLGNTAHGSLDKYMSEGAPIESVVQKLDRLSIQFSFEKENNEVLSVLANPEWSIIPSRSLKHSLWKVDFSNTTGAYYVEKELTDGYVLKVNKRHYRHHNKLASTIILKSIGHNEKEVFKSLEAGAIDVLPISYGINGLNILKNFSTNDNYNIHTTQSIQLHYIQYTKKGLREISQDRRLKLGSLFRDIYSRDSEGREEVRLANAFFSVFGMSTIAPKLEKQVLNQYKEQNHNSETGKGLIIQARSEDVRDKYITLFSSFLPDAKYHVPAEIKNDVISNVSIGNIDSGFDDDIALLSYCESIGLFDGIVTSSGEWLNKYTRSNKQKRKLMFDELHRKMLTSPSVVPLRTLPYVALSKRPWIINQTSLTASMPFWSIEHE